MERFAKDESDSAVANVDGSRRVRLREFQARLVERMAAARRGTEAIGNQLGILVGEHRYLLDLREAGEIVSVGHVTIVPLTRDWYLGLSNIRGNLTGVIDLARFCGEASATVEPHTRVVAFAPALSFNCGLLVKQVLGLRNAADMQLRPNTSGKPWILNQYFDRDGQLWQELSLSHLAQDPEFLHIGI